MSGWREFWDVVTHSFAGEREPQMPKGVRIKVGDEVATTLGVEYAGRREDGIDQWHAVMLWPRHRRLPLGQVQVLIDEVPAKTEVTVRVQWT